MAGGGADDVADDAAQGRSGGEDRTAQNLLQRHGRPAAPAARPHPHRRQHGGGGRVEGLVHGAPCAGESCVIVSVQRNVGCLLACLTSRQHASVS